MRAMVVTSDVTGISTEIFRFARKRSSVGRIDAATCTVPMLKGLSPAGEFIGSICDALGTLNRALTMQESYGAGGLLIAYCMPLFSEAVDDGSYARKVMPDVSPDTIDAAKECVIANYASARFGHVICVGHDSARVGEAMHAIGIDVPPVCVPDHASALMLCERAVRDGF